MKNFDKFLQDLKTLISFESVSGKSSDGAPFGKETKRALDWFLNKAESFGFKTINYDGYAGEIDFGEGEELGIIGHLDVVPAGFGWNTPPFLLTEKNGVLYGRGLGDDKAPMLVILYVLKELKDEGILPERKFRLFVGCDEEVGWRDLKKLKSMTVMPEYGFSPDGNFPVSYAEKGIYVIKFFLPQFKNHSNIKGGTVINAVCDRASVKPSYYPDMNALNKYSLTFENGEIVSVGKSAHGSKPELGINAIKPLLNYLAENGEDTACAVECLFDDKYGLTLKENEQGRITLSPDLIYEDGGNVVIECDCRVPAPFTFETVKEAVDKFSIPYEVTERHLPQMVGKDSFLIKKLLSSYEEVVGKSGEPISQSGSTFARAFEKGVAFGPEFENKSASIHEANEHVSKDDLFTLFEIYKRALTTLSFKE